MQLIDALKILGGALVGATAGAAAGAPLVDMFAPPHTIHLAATAVVLIFTAAGSLGGALTGLPSAPVRKRGKRRRRKNG